MRTAGGLAVGVVAAAAAALGGVRLANSRRFPDPLRAHPGPGDAAGYPRRLPGVTVTPVSGSRLAGFHLRPDTLSRRGVVVGYGGSEGGCDFARASALAGQGYEVLALFVFGQPNQPRRLQQVPVESFGEALG